MDLIGVVNVHLSGMSNHKNIQKIKHKNSEILYLKWSIATVSTLVINMK